MKLAADLRNKRYGRLKVISRAPSDKKGNPRWKCRCDCGRSHVLRGSSLVSGGTKSCGCILLEKSAKRCSISGCDRKCHAKGLCSSHYSSYCYHNPGMYRKRAAVLKYEREHSGRTDVERKKVAAAARIRYWNNPEKRREIARRHYRSETYKKTHSKYKESEQWMRLRFKLPVAAPIELCEAIILLNKLIKEKRNYEHKRT